MKATETKLLAFLQKSPQFVIPLYQRTYSWTDKQCRQLCRNRGCRNRGETPVSPDLCFPLTPISPLFPP
jgi:hypothetical protein